MSTDAREQAYDSQKEKMRDESPTPRTSRTAVPHFLAFPAQLEPHLAPTMSIERPSRPAVAAYPDTAAHADELAEAKALFEQEIASPESEWEDQGEREGVKLWKKVDTDVRSVAPRCDSLAVA